MFGKKPVETTTEAAKCPFKVETPVEAAAPAPTTVAENATKAVVKSVAKPAKKTAPKKPATKKAPRKPKASKPQA